LPHTALPDLLRPCHVAYLVCMYCAASLLCCLHSKLCTCSGDGPLAHEQSERPLVTNQHTLRPRCVPGVSCQCASTLSDGYYMWNSPVSRVALYDMPTSSSVNSSSRVVWPTLVGTTLAPHCRAAHSSCHYPPLLCSLKCGYVIVRIIGRPLYISH
jgi:hypothetical protein